jgi:hypothetical protein
MQAVLSVTGLLLLPIQAAVAFENSPAAETSPARRPIEELFQTELVYPQQRGEMQVTLAPSFHREREQDLWRAPVGLEYGLTDSWELGLHWDAAVYRHPENGTSAYGVGDLELEAKYSFMNLGKAGFHAAFGFGVQFPVGSVDKGLSEGFMEYEPFLVLAKDLPALHQAQVFLQTGLNFVQRVKTADTADETEPAAHELFMSGGFFLPINPFVLSTELTWTNNRWNHDGTENAWYVTPGLTWRLGHEWEVGAGVSVGLTDDSDHWRLILQVTKEF